MSKKSSFSAGGVLTKEILEEAYDKMIEVSSISPPEYIHVSEDQHKQLLKMQKQLEILNKVRNSSLYKAMNE